MPCASRRSRMCGTAAADSSLLTVTRTNSEPARANALTCATVPSISAVSVLVIDCTTMGKVPPMETEPTFTARECRRVLMAALYLGRRDWADGYDRCDAFTRNRVPGAKKGRCDHRAGRSAGRGFGVRYDFLGLRGAAIRAVCRGCGDHRGHWFARQRQFRSHRTRGFDRGACVGVVGLLRDCAANSVAG